MPKNKFHAHLILILCDWLRLSENDNKNQADVLLYNMLFLGFCNHFSSSRFCRHFNLILLALVKIYQRCSPLKGTWLLKFTWCNKQFFELVECHISPYRFCRIFCQLPSILQLTSLLIFAALVSPGERACLHVFFLLFSVDWVLWVLWA